MPFIVALLVAALLLPAGVRAQDQESWNAHFQATYICQVQPAFRSPYEGPDSLRGARAASYSITATACQYLQRGGITSFLGDGALRYGRERLAELYYNADLGAGCALTADVQRIVNPGYNRDRGPASFYALRLHWEI